MWEDAPSTREVKSLSVTEPTTMATDYAIAIVSAFLASSLISRRRSRGRGAVGLWVAAYVATLVAAVAGGTAHGFRLHLSPSAWSAVWKLTVGSIGSSALLFVAAGMRSALRPEARSVEERAQGIRWLKRGILLTVMGLLILLARLSLHDHFNQNDIYHVFQLAGLYCLYRGARALHALELTSGPRP